MYVVVRNKKTNLFDTSVKGSKYIQNVTSANYCQRYLKSFKSSL